MKHAMKEIEGLGLTKQRQTVLRVIRKSVKHLTANEVFNDARRLLPSISFATVYNSLNYLKGQGLIGEIKFGTDANLYDRKLTRHNHAFCNKCEKLVDLELTIPNKLLEEAANRSKFKPETIELTLRGLCPECSEREI
jgi:Fur family ferric uptake transcriptional regulator/Fur family peroxide stress response transcriptional regulator